MKGISYKLQSFILISIVIVSSCTKEDNSKDINALKESVTALQKRSDSLAAALGNTNSTVLTISKSIDSIKIQLSGIVLQLNSLNSQLSQLSANVLALNAQITLLNKQYAELLDKLNQILAQLSVTPTSLSTGLVAYYPFTGNAIDSSGNGNNGLVNGPTLTNDRFNNSNSSYLFNGGSITIPHNATLGFTQTSSFSVSFWAYRTGNQARMHFLGKRANGSFVFNWQVYFAVGAVPGMEFITHNGAVYGARSTTLCPVNSWVNIVAVYDRNRWELFYKGSSIAKTIVAQLNADSNCPMTIGNAGGFEPFYGKLDDIRIYNRALTQEEITFLANH